jgi:O-antigen/teichoic acid export membrane protein
MLCGVGGWIVRLIWDERYWGAASFLPILCLRAATSCLVTPAESCLTALGEPRYGFLRSVLRALSVWIALPIGFHFGGVSGMVWAIAVTELPSLALMWFRFQRIGMLRIERELFAVAVFVAAYLVGSAIVPWLPDWHLPHRK